VLDVIQAYAPDDGDFICRNGTEEFLDRDFLVCDLCGWVEDVVVFDVDYLGF
jgi:hypothetical protein